MATTLAEVREFIRHATKADLETVGDILQSRWKHLAAELSFTFAPGNTVSWVRGKRDPRREKGKVIAVDARWVYVQMYQPPPGNPQKWDIKVSPTLCKKESDTSW